MNIEFNFQLTFFCWSCLTFLLSQFIRNMMTFFSKMFRCNNDSGGAQNAPPLMSVTIHHVQQVSGMSQLSTTSLVEALTSVGVDIKTSLYSFGADIHNGLGKIEKC